jgi:hypothetical protein
MKKNKRNRCSFPSLIGPAVILCLYDPAQYEEERRYAHSDSDTDCGQKAANAENEILFLGHRLCALARYFHVVS